MSLLPMQLADALAASTTMRSYVAPIITTLCVIASLVCTAFLVIGGIQYMSSRGKPESLEHAKTTLKNALLGLVLVIAAATLTAILSHAYNAAAVNTTAKLPSLVPIQENASLSFWDVVTKAIVHVLQSIIGSLGQPFVQALTYFTKGTPLMGDNSAVFNMWLVIVAIADTAFVLVVALLGFHVMSFSTLGFDELDIKQLLPQLALVFLLMNTSIFAIDGVISFSNAMIHALQDAFPPMSLWDQLTEVTKQASANLGLGGLLVMLAFIVLTVLLLIYYVGRLITLYIGAALSPLIVLLYLIPAFKDFAVTAAKVYLTTIFVLFVQVVVMLLASSIFTGMLEGSTSGQPNTLMALIVGLATVLALLKTQGVMKELSYAASTPRAARAMATSFMRSMSSAYNTEEAFRKDARTVTRFIKRKMNQKKSSGTDSNGEGDTDSPGDSGTPRRRHALRTGETQLAASSSDGSFPAEELGFGVERLPRERLAEE